MQPTSPGPLPANPLEAAQLELRFLELEIQRLQNQLTALEENRVTLQELQKVHGRLAEKAAVRMALEDQIRRLRPTLSPTELAAAMDRHGLRIRGTSKVVPQGGQALAHVSPELAGLLPLFMEAALTEGVQKLLVNDLTEVRSLSLEVSSSQGLTPTELSELQLNISRYIGGLARTWGKELNATLLIEHKPVIRIRAQKGQVIVDHYSSKRSKTIKV